MIGRDILKKLSMLIVIIIILIIAFFVISQNLSNDVSPPEITALETASVIYGFNNYTQEMDFEPGDTVYIYEEYTNITHDNVCDFTISLKVEGYNISEFIADNINYTEYVYYNDSKDVHLVDDVEKGRFWSFDTDESWSQDIYVVSSLLKDHISGKTSYAETLFFIEQDSFLI